MCAWVLARVCVWVCVIVCVGTMRWARGVPCTKTKTLYVCVPPYYVVDENGIITTHFWYIYTHRWHHAGELGSSGIVHVCLSVPFRAFEICVCWGPKAVDAAVATDKCTPSVRACTSRLRMKQKRTHECTRSSPYFPLACSPRARPLLSNSIRTVWWKLNRKFLYFLFLLSFTHAMPPQPPPISHLPVARFWVFFFSSFPVGVLPSNGFG